MLSIIHLRIFTRVFLEMNKVKVGDMVFCLVAGCFCLVTNEETRKNTNKALVSSVDKFIYVGHSRVRIEFGSGYGIYTTIFREED